MEIISAPVDVYYNLHKRLWSVRDRKSGLVAAHSRVVSFAVAAELVVRPAGHRRVLETGQKNVHAFARGIEAEIGGDPVFWQAFARNVPNGQRITYRPQEAATFLIAATGQPIAKVSALIMVAIEGKGPEVWGVPA